MLQAFASLPVKRFGKKLQTPAAAKVTKTMLQAMDVFKEEHGTVYRPLEALVLAQLLNRYVVLIVSEYSSPTHFYQLQNMMPHQRLTSETEIRDSISHLARLNNCSRELALAAEYLNAARGGDTKSLLEATKIIDAVRQYAEPTNDALNPAGADGLALPTVLEDTSAAEKFKSLVQDCGVSPHKVSELLQDLPSRKHCDALINYYFTSMCVAVTELNRCR
jgi:hypothetical protein